MDEWAVDHSTSAIIGKTAILKNTLNNASAKLWKKN